MKFPDKEIERDIKRMIESHMPEGKREAALAWLKARIVLFKSVERLG